MCERKTPLPSGSCRSGVTVAVMSGQTAYAEITRAPEAAGTQQEDVKRLYKETCTRLRDTRPPWSCDAKWEDSKCLDR